jgi:signal peptidase I
MRIHSIRVPEEPKRPIRLPPALKGLVGALVLVLIILGSLFAYSGLWPPLVVVESDSMQHSDDSSSIGTIDTGDLVIVKKTRAEDLRTYLEGQVSDYSTYGEYGDVVIYYRYGNTGYKSVIHRAILWLEYNTTGGGFDLPELANLPGEQWSVIDAEEQVWWNLQGAVEIYDIGYMEVTLQLDLASMLAYFESRGRTPHSGYITMGDHNLATQAGTLIGMYDQLAICREPVQENWIVGVSRGELPWFGLLKLWVTGDAPDNVPSNSVTNLWISLGLIIGIPLVMDVAGVVAKRRGIDLFTWTKKFRLGDLLKRIRGRTKDGQEDDREKDR